MLTSPPGESDGSLQNIFDQLRELYARELRVQVFRPACAGGIANDFGLRGEAAHDAFLPQSRLLPILNQAEPHPMEKSSKDKPIMR